MPTKPCLFLLFCSFALPAIAESPAVKIDGGMKRCQDSAQTTLGMSACYQKATAAWDKELNIQYQALLKESPQSVRDALRHSQRAWITYQEAYNQATDAFYTQEQGTIWRVIAAETRMNVIKDKTLDLYRLRQSTSLGN